MLSELSVVSFTLAAAALAAAAQYLFKRNVHAFGTDIGEIFAMLTKRPVVLGFVVYLASFVVYIYALSGAPSVSFVYPVFASTFVFVLLISKYALKERMGISRIAGVALIIIGIILVAMTYG